MPLVPLPGPSLRCNPRADGASAGYREREAHRHEAARSVLPRILPRRWIDDALGLVTRIDDRRHPR